MQIRYIISYISHYKYILQIWIFNYWVNYSLLFIIIIIYYWLLLIIINVIYKLYNVFYMSKIRTITFIAKSIIIQFNNNVRIYSLLGHVKQCLVVIQPEIMIWYWHLVESNFFCIFEETVRSPDVMQPVHVEYSVIFGHVLWQPQSRIPPTLREKYVGHVRLLPQKNHVNMNSALYMQP